MIDRSQPSAWQPIRWPLARARGSFRCVSSNAVLWNVQSHVFGVVERQNASSGSFNLQHLDAKGLISFTSYILQDTCPSSDLQMKSSDLWLQNVLEKKYQ